MKGTIAAIKARTIKQIKEVTTVEARIATAERVTGRMRAIMMKVIIPVDGKEEMMTGIIIKVVRNTVTGVTMEIRVTAMESQRTKIITVRMIMRTRDRGAIHPVVIIVVPIDASRNTMIMNADRITIAARVIVTMVAIMAVLTEAIVMEIRNLVVDNSVMVSVTAEIMVLTVAVIMVHHDRMSNGSADGGISTTDEVSSWFGNEDAERRREQDHRWEGTHRGKGPKGYQRSDDRIRDDVNDRLSDDAFLDASNIDVTVSSGEVT